MIFSTNLENTFYIDGYSLWQPFYSFHQKVWNIRKKWRCK